MSRPLAIIILLAAVSWLAAPAPAAELKGPKIVFDQTEKVLPSAVEGKTLVANFTFTNAGDQNLIIDKVNPSCGCTATKFDRVTKPGGKGVITLELDTTGINGAYRKTAAVSTNDPSQPVVTLVMLGETLSRIKVDKGRRLDLSGCLGQDISTTATISDPLGKPLVISGVDNPMKDYLEVSLDPQPGGKTYKLHVTAKAKEPMEFAGPLFFKVPGGAPVSIWVLANIKGPFTVQPHEVHFGTLTKGVRNKAARSVLIKRACAPKLDIKEVRYPQQMFKVERHWKKPGEELLLVITPRLENFMPGSFAKALEIQAGDKVFTVRLVGSVH